MSGTGAETLTAALRRLGDEHASGVLAVATPGREVVLELADGVPVGIGPSHDVGHRVGRDAEAGLMAAAIVDDLVDRTVSAIVGGGGSWTWDVTDPGSLMPVPPGLATELSRRAVDAAQALALLPPETVLLPGHQLEAHGEVGRVAALFDGERTIAEVAEAADLTVAATATHAAALVRSGLVTTGLEDRTPDSWTDTVAATGDHASDDEDDEPELWVMDPPDPDPEPEPEPEPEAAPAGEAAPALDPAAAPEPAGEAAPELDPAAAPDPVDEAARSAAREVAPEPTAEPTPEPMADAAPEPAAALADDGAAAGGVQGGEDDDWADSRWLDDLPDGNTDARTGSAGDTPGRDPRAALTAMFGDLLGATDGAPGERDTAPATAHDPAGDGRADPAEDEDDEPPTEQVRREPKAAPGQVADFLRELSRLALDDD